MIVALILTDTQAIIPIKLEVNKEASACDISLVRHSTEYVELMMHIHFLSIYNAVCVCALFSMKNKKKTSLSIINFSINIVIYIATPGFFRCCCFFFSFSLVWCYIIRYHENICSALRCVVFSEYLRY